MKTIDYSKEYYYDIILQDILVASPQQTVYKHIVIVKLLYVCMESYNKAGRWSFQISCSKSLKLLYVLLAMDFITTNELKSIISKIKGPHKESMQRYLYDKFNIEHNYAPNLWIRDHR